MQCILIMFIFIIEINQLALKTNQLGILLNRAPEFEQENQFNKIGLGDSATAIAQRGSQPNFRQRLEQPEP